MCPPLSACTGIVNDPSVALGTGWSASKYSARLAALTCQRIMCRVTSRSVITDRTGLMDCQGVMSCLVVFWPTVGPASDTYPSGVQGAANAVLVSAGRAVPAGAIQRPPVGPGVPTRTSFAVRLGAQAANGSAPGRSSVSAAGI